MYTMNVPGQRLLHKIERTQELDNAIGEFLKDRSKGLVIKQGDIDVKFVDRTPAKQNVDKITRQANKMLKRTDARLEKMG